MKTLLVSMLLLFISGSSFGQLEMIFTQHPLPFEFECLNVGECLKKNKIPKIIQTKILDSYDTTIETTKYSREGIYLGTDYNDQNFEFEDLILKINDDTFSVFKKTKGNLILNYKIVFEKIGDSIKKDYYLFPNGALHNSHVFDSKSKRLIYFEQPYGKDTWYVLNMCYKKDSTFINYKNYHFIRQELNLKWYESEGVLYVDYYNSENRIYKNEQFYKISNQYIPKSNCLIDSIGKTHYSFQNPIISNNNCDSILYHYYPFDTTSSKWIVINKNKNGEIIYQKNLSENGFENFEIFYKYYKFGKRKRDFKERKIIYNETITLVKVKIKYYLFTKKPIDRWLKKNN